MVIAGALTLTLLGGLAFDYARWMCRRREAERAFSRVGTSRGVVPYLDLGPRSAPVVLFCPGGGAGVDLVHAFPWLLEGRYRVLSISRPGYYGVPIQPQDDLRAHADLYAEVLGCLKIREPVHVFGISAGGPSALLYAARHPTRSLTLWCAITGPYRPNREAIESPLGRLVLSRRGQALISWILGRSAQLFPRSTMATFLQTESSLEKTQIRALVDHELASPRGRKAFRAFVESTTPMPKLYEGMMDEVAKMGEAWAVPWDAIDVPVLAASSPADTDVSPEHIARLKAALPQARVLEPRAGGHFVWWGHDGATVVSATLEHLSAAQQRRSNL